MFSSQGIVEGNQKIVGNGLVLNLDAAQLRSYPGSGTTWTDLSGNNKDGTLTNGPTFNSADGGSIVFDGTNDYVSTTLNIDANPNTICAWCYPTAITSINGYGVVLTDNGGWDKGFEINNSLWQIHTGNTLVNTNIPAKVNTWQFACISYTNSATKFYVNGRLVYTGAAPAATAGSNVEIGRANYLGGAGSRWFVGRISSVQIYNRELSEAEVLNNFNAVKSRFGYPNESIVTSGLILNHDAEYAISYPGSGTFWNSLTLFGATMSGTVAYTNTSPKSFNYVNGTTNYFQGNNTLNSTVISGVTIISWINVTNIAVRSAVFSKYNSTAPFGYSFEVGTASGSWTNTLRFFTQGTVAASSDYRGVANAISQNTNVMVTATFDFATKTTAMYVNGSAISATQVGGTPGSISSDWYNSNISYKIGSMRPAATIDAAMNQYNLLVYNRALSAAEIKQNFDSQKSRFGL